MQSKYCHKVFLHSGNKRERFIYVVTYTIHNMNHELSQYDRQGLIPSRGVKTVDEYLREAEQKRGLLEKLQERPHELIEGKFQIETLTGKSLDQFVRKFDTVPLPAIVAGKADFKRIYTAESLRHKLTYYVTFGAIDGGFLQPDKKIKLFVPIIVDSQAKEKKEAFIAHEAVHSLRNQWQTFFSDAKTRSLEETMAYLSDKSATETAYMTLQGGVAYSILNSFMLRLPLTIGAAVMGYASHGWAGGAVGLLYLPALDLINTVPQLLNAERIMKKGFKEGINPNYLFLRANLNEFNLRQSLEEQIAKKQGVKWDVMRATLDIQKAHQTKSFVWPAKYISGN